MVADCLMQKIILSLVGLNLALAGYLVVALTHPTPRTRASAANGSAVAPSDTNVAAASRLKPAASINRSSGEKVTWASLASSDLRRYAENLRRVDCPEQTIKDIMLAEVNRRYAIQERALKLRPDDVAPWETAAAYDRRGNETKLRQLLEEKRTLLKDLTGVDVGIDMPSRLAGRDVEKFEGAYTAVPDAKRDQVRAVQENYWAQSDDIKQRTMGYLEPEDRDEFVRIKNERRDALAKVLTPGEMQDYELKTSETAPALRNRLKSFEITDEEFRKVFDFVQPLDERYSLTRRNPDPVSEEFTASRTKAEKDVQEYLRSVVGDERYAEYQRTEDPVYRSISQAGAEAGLPKESILLAYQAQQQMQDESKRILQDPALTQEQRAQTLNDMRVQGQQRMQQILGDKGTQILQQLPANQLAVRYGLPLERIQTIPNPGPGNAGPPVP
jgi:hypothetical protein